MKEYSHQSVKYLKVLDEFEDQRIDNYLLRELKSVPKSHIYKLLRSGQIRVNKGRIKASYKLAAGDVIRVPPIHLAPARKIEAIKPELIELIADRVLFENDSILIINKPSGLPVHAGSGLGYGLIDVVKAVYPNEKQLELAHRLDKGTSGCLVLAKKRSALKVLHEAFREDNIQKEYLALTKGRWASQEKHVNLPLKRYETPSGERSVRVSVPEGKSATTWFESVRKFDGLELVLAKPVTGRTHQIRVHCKAVGHEIAGDDKYGDRDLNRHMRNIGLNRMFLHAKSIEVPLNGGGRKKIEAPLDQNLESLLDQL